MMYVCPACKGETYSKSNRMKSSTCDDCYAENPITDATTLSCACHDVGHDQSKIPTIKPISKSLESEMKVLIGKDESVSSESRRDEKKNSS